MSIAFLFSNTNSEILRSSPKNDLKKSLVQVSN